ncbi:ABC transporter substrate-binding protein [Okeania sp.]|uniref:ABC transporter substrate-binding protein n=1 Tax=Okeania sp. TaxID=3100323 RepID=UPI002B4ABED2|nr:ABC transporter substrate-binding protein [Okeania sp.]MEB3340782.1 ABC transporter substrate-binding protein [Okeania sp.]
MNRILRIKLLRLILLSFIVFSVAACDSNTQSSSKTIPDNGETLSDNSSNISERITFGEKSLAPPKESFNPQREIAVIAITNGQFDTAIRILTDYLKSEPNDPEARIFLNNLEIEKIKKPSTIAVSMPFSSELPKSLEVLRGVAHAQYDWNQKNNDLRGNGAMLKIAIASDDNDTIYDNDAETAKKVATELGKRKEILGVVGHYSSEASKAVADMYKNSQLVYISPTSTSVSLTGTPYFFRTVPSDKVAAEALVRYAKDKLDVEKAVVFYNSDNDYSKSLREKFRNEFGNSNIILADDDNCDLSKWLDDDSSDWGEKAANVLSEAEKDKDSENLLVVLAPTSGDLSKALEIVRVNKRRFPIVAGDAVYSSKTIEQDQNALGIIVAVAWHIDANNQNSDFLNRAQKLWGTSQVSWRTITAYDATIALAKAINDQTEPTREGVQEKLSSDFSSPGAFATVKFLDTGDYDGDIQLVEVQNTGSGYDFVPIDP